MGEKAKAWYQRSKHWLVMGAGMLGAGLLMLRPDTWYWG